MPDEHRYCVFVSHASGDRLALTGKYLLRFIKEVESRLNSVDPRQGDSRRLFLDRRDIEFGDAWETALQQAVCSSRALLCLVSPRYLISECECVLGRQHSRWQKVGGSLDDRFE